jgi:hypothetical protein
LKDLPPQIAPPRRFQLAAPDHKTLGHRPPHIRSSLHQHSEAGVRDDDARFLPVNPEAIALLKVLHGTDASNQSRETAGAALAGGRAVVDPAPGP